MSRIQEIAIIIISASIYGLTWGAIYLFFSALHGMQEMFNNEFIFFTASVLNIELKTKIISFLFAFTDGALLGIIVALVFIRISRTFS